MSQRKVQRQKATVETKKTSDGGSPNNGSSSPLASQNGNKLAEDKEIHDLEEVEQ